MEKDKLTSIIVKIKPNDKFKLKLCQAKLMGILGRKVGQSEAASIVLSKGLEVFEKENIPYKMMTKMSSIKPSNTSKVAHKDLGILREAISNILIPDAEMFTSSKDIADMLDGKFWSNDIAKVLKELGFVQKRTKHAKGWLAKKK